MQEARVKQQPADACCNSNKHVSILLNPAHELTARFVVVVTLEALISRFRLADHRVAIGSPTQVAQPLVSGESDEGIAVCFRMSVHAVT